MNNNNILFIDDQYDVLMAYKEILFTGGNPHNLMISWAFQGKDGVELIKSRLLEDNPFKAVFVDLSMPPGINGIETIKLIRAIDPNIEIVLVTGNETKNLSSTLESLGGDRDKLLFFKKPLDPDELRLLCGNLCTKYFSNVVDNIENTIGKVSA